MAGPIQKINRLFEAAYAVDAPFLQGSLLVPIKAHRPESPEHLQLIFSFSGCSYKRALAVDSKDSYHQEDHAVLIASTAKTTHPIQF